MANLAQMVMEGTSYLGSSKLPHHYGHEDGAGLIAMESAEALRDIFETSFYKENECQLKATMEGASSIWESTQATVMEGIFADAFEKIKQFFIKLKDKVKEFLHNIKRYLTGIFGNDEKWVKTYKSELTALKNLKGYEIKMYDYRSDLDDILTKEDISKFVTAMISLVDNGIEGKLGSGEDKLQEEADKQYLAMVKEFCDASDDDDLDKDIWSYIRNGATDESDMDTVDVSSKLSTMISTLENSTKKVAALDKMISATDKVYNAAIKETDKAKTQAEKSADEAKDEASRENGSEIVSYLRILSSTISKMQSAHNKFNNAWKSAMQERNSAYKKALTGAFAYDRKNKK